MWFGNGGGNFGACASGAGFMQGIQTQAQMAQQSGNRTAFKDDMKYNREMQNDYRNDHGGPLTQGQAKHLAKELGQNAQRLGSYNGLQGTCFQGFG